MIRTTRVVRGLAVALAVLASVAIADQTSAAQVPDATEQGVTAKAAGGTISGRVQFARKMRLRKNELVNVLVSVEDIESSAEELKANIASHSKPSIDQKDLTFHPHVLAIVVGETVAFPNSDPLFHNVYSQAKVKTFNLGMYPKGSSKEIAFDEPGLVELHCNVHAEMQAFIHIKKNPYFTTVQRDGTFRIENVPPGVHKILVWHPKAEPIESEVTVESGSNAELDLEFTKRRRRKR